MFIGTPTGIVERDEPAAELGGPGARAELARDAVGLAGVDGEHVPVQWTVGRGAELAEQLDLVVGEHVEATLHDALERGAGVRAGLLAHRDQLVVSGPAAGDRITVAVGVRARLREREPERAGVERPAELGTHLGDLLRRGLAADRVGAHDVAADGAVAGEEARVHRDVALEAVEELVEGLPLPVGALLERGQRHALDLRHHLAEVVGLGIGLVHGREAEAAVAPDDSGDAVHARRARGGVPHELCVVVRVGIDEAGRDDAPRGVGDAVGRLVDLADGDDPPVLDADVGTDARCAGAVDDGAALDDLVEHADRLVVWLRRWLRRLASSLGWVLGGGVPPVFRAGSDAASDCSLGRISEPEDCTTTGDTT